jgi:Ca2+:H+ antiporter
MPPLRDIPTAETESSSPAVPRSGADDYSWVRHLHHRAELREKKKGSCSGLVHIFCSPICLMLFCLPVGLMSNYVWHNDTLTFWMMFGAMLPLAKILGDATEELALCLNNDMLSGLLNATFGNAVEMIMTVSFLQSHEYQVVKMTLIGSVLSNMLLVLGMSFFFWRVGEVEVEVEVGQWQH